MPTTENENGRLNSTPEGSSHSRRATSSDNTRADDRPAIDAGSNPSGKTSRRREFLKQLRQCSNEQEVRKQAENSYPTLSFLKKLNRNKARIELLEVEVARTTALYTECNARLQRTPQQLRFWTEATCPSLKSGAGIGRAALSLFWLAVVTAGSGAEIINATGLVLAADMEGIATWWEALAFSAWTFIAPFVLFKCFFRSTSEQARKLFESKLLKRGAILVMTVMIFFGLKVGAMHEPFDPMRTEGWMPSFGILYCGIQFVLAFSVALASRFLADSFAELIGANYAPNPKYEALQAQVNEHQSKLEKLTQDLADAMSGVEARVSRIAAFQDLCVRLWRQQQESARKRKALANAQAEMAASQ